VKSSKPTVKTNNVSKTAKAWAPGDTTIKGASKGDVIKRGGATKFDKTAGTKKK